MPVNGWSDRVGHIQDLLRNNNLMNAADNGFWAKAGHLGTHTDDYIKDVVKAFEDVDNAAGAKVALANLKAKIMNGEYL